MTAVLIVVIVLLAVALVAVAARGQLGRRPRASLPAPVAESPRILFPFLASALSQRALDSALRVARAEGATLYPVYLARVPRELPIDTPLPRQAETAVATQEAIEQRAAEFGVPVDARIQRGRTFRHALAQAINHERYDRIVIAAAVPGGAGLHPDDVAWLLRKAPGEILVVRPARDDTFQRPRAPLPQRSNRSVAVHASYV